MPSSGGRSSIISMTVASMDMTWIYRKATREAVPDPAICLDPFHAMRWVDEALDVVYKSTPRSEMDGSISGLEWRRTRTAIRTGAIAASYVEYPTFHNATGGYRTSPLSPRAG